MDEILLEKLLKLKKDIQDSDIYKRYVYLCNEINNNNVLLKLRDDLYKLKKEYDLLLKSNASENKINKIKNKYLILNKKYHDNELIKEYLVIYKELKDIYMYIDDNLIYIFDKDIEI